MKRFLDAMMRGDELLWLEGYTRLGKLRAAYRWALIDGDETDGPSVDALGIDYRFPEPGDLASSEVIVQLYWPAIGPHDLAYRRTGVAS